MLFKKTPIFIFLIGILATSGFTQQLIRGPYIQNLSMNRVDILWRTDQPVESIVQIWQKGSTEAKTYSCSVPMIAHEIRIPALQTDTRYTYRVGYRGQALSKPSTFRTFQELEATQYSFVAFGDHRNNPEAHRSVVEAVLKKGLPRFVLDTGDLTGQGEHEIDFYDEQFFGPKEI